ncbi:hypothetical protein Vadar_010756 [Vaccinium darrowii]|uniref:Uncharacterized protein n=1 Tax=Vaccinium darrowii TaxID=229202 RepID=A0ACB7WZM7_9ERIC|nr:hypothetical protein Vadar_010756 [Vaccinium darrowii]
MYERLIMDYYGHVLQAGEENLFGKYEFGKLLGYGASAKVYRAKNLRTGQSVAIKVISKQKVLERGLTEHVKREISIMRQLRRHPHIVRLYEVLATKAKIYLVLEYAKGGELLAEVKKAGRFSEDLSRRYFQQLISAVGYCHSRGIFHRDLKSENILLDENRDLKLTDFGISAVTDQIQSDGLLHTFCGTPAYLAPEILAKLGYDGAKVDIWSCGIILYTMNAGYLPFNDPNLYWKIYKGEFRCPDWTSPELKRFLSRLLDSSPSTRITVDQIINDPWFRKGYKNIPTNSDDDLFGLEDCDDNRKDYSLNAFDIISFSSGLNLSGLFSPPNCSIEVERFVSAESPERIIEEVVKAEEGRMTVVRRKDLGVKVERPNGEIVFTVDIHRLTEELVIVEIRRRGNEDGPSCELWDDKLRPLLRTLIYKPEPRVTDLFTIDHEKSPKSVHNRSLSASLCTTISILRSTDNRSSIGTGTRWQLDLSAVSFAGIQFSSSTSDGGSQFQTFPGGVSVDEVTVSISVAFISNRKEDLK